MNAAITAYYFVLSVSKWIHYRPIGRRQCSFLDSSADGACSRLPPPSMKRAVTFKRHWDERISMLATSSLVTVGWMQSHQHGNSVPTVVIMWVLHSTSPNCVFWVSSFQWPLFARSRWALRCCQKLWLTFHNIILSRYSLVQKVGISWNELVRVWITEDNSSIIRWSNWMQPNMTY